MRVLLDTGVFLDFLSQVSHRALRTADRRGRSPALLAADAGRLLERLGRNHGAGVAVHAFMEAEDVLFQAMRSEVRGLVFAEALCVSAARGIVHQMRTLVRTFAIEPVSLTAALLERVLREPSLYAGVRSADAMHVAAALEFAADMIVTTDADILRLDGRLRRDDGETLRCVDTDAALDAVP